MTGLHDLGQRGCLMPVTDAESCEPSALGATDAPNASRTTPYAVMEMASANDRKSTEFESLWCA
jgi:hypothetical protein